MKKALYPLIFALIGGLIVFLGIRFSGSGTTVRYVSMTKIFDECNLKNKFAGELGSLEKMSNEKLSSLQQDLDKYSAGPKAEASVIESMKENLLAGQKALTDEYTKKTKEYEAEIWKEINAKVIAYGKENQIDFILGAKGDGTIMFASDSKDISEEVIQYINQGE